MKAGTETQLLSFWYDMVQQNGDKRVLEGMLLVLAQEFPDQFKYDYAVSREDKNAAGQKMSLGPGFEQFFA